MESTLAKQTPVKEAPAEWYLAFRDVLFLSKSHFVDFLSQFNLTPNQLEFNVQTGRCTGKGGIYSCESRDSGIRLYGHGIDLLYAAIDAPLDDVKKELTHFSRPISIIERDCSELLFPHELEMIPQLDGMRDDPIGRELSLARLIRQLYKTESLSDFKNHFNQLVEELRDGIPYTSRGKNALNQGRTLQLYLTSFITDPLRLSSEIESKASGSLELLESADCIADETRTKKFLSAVRHAVSSKLAQTESDLNILDAGCGAIPIQAIQAALIDPRVKVTALEISPKSAEMARQIVKSIGLCNQIDVVVDDALTYVPDRKVDLIISETLQAALAGEFVVQILNHLGQYLSDGGSMIPVSANVRVGLIPVSQHTAPTETISTKLEDVPVTTPIWLKEISHVFGEPLEKIRFEISAAPSVNEDVVVCVGISVNLGNETLEHNESFITMPRLVLDALKIQDQDPMIYDGNEKRFLVSYSPGGVPVGLFLKS